VRTAETKGYVPSMSMRAGVVKDEIKRMADVYVERIETQLSHWGTRLDDLTAHADVDGAPISVEGPLRIGDLESKYQATQTKLAAWKAVSGLKWGTCKLRVEQAWDDLEGAFEDLRNGFARGD
jgi:hypothetical protein